MGICGLNIWSPASPPRSNAKCWSLVVFLYRNVRLVPKFLSGRVLASFVVLRWRLDNPSTDTASFCPHNPSGDFRDFETVPLDLSDTFFFLLLWPCYHYDRCIPIDAIHLRWNLQLCYMPLSRTSVLLSLDLCWKWKCKFLLCHYIGMDFGVECVGRGRAICGAEG